MGDEYIYLVISGSQMLVPTAEKSILPMQIICSLQSVHQFNISFLHLPFQIPFNHCS